VKYKPAPASQIKAQLTLHRARDFQTSHDFVMLLDEYRRNDDEAALSESNTFMGPKCPWDLTSSEMRFRVAQLNFRNVMGTLYPLKLARTSPTSGGRSVGIVHLRTKATE
jgi:hypothetical protein